MMSSQVTSSQREKIRIEIKPDEVPNEELELILENPEVKTGNDNDQQPKEPLWKVSDNNAKFENTLYKSFKYLAPAFSYILDTESNKNENKDKTINFIFKNNMFGFRNNAGYIFLWRIKSIGGSSGSGSSNSSRPQNPPLAELFFGTIHECNAKLTDESQRWYLAETQIVKNEQAVIASADQISNIPSVTAYGILKRNRFIPTTMTGGGFAAASSPQH